jgi:hypothetical protein
VTRSNVTTSKDRSSASRSFGSDIGLRDERPPLVDLTRLKPKAQRH